MLKSSVFLENTNWSLKTQLDVKFFLKHPHITRVPCILGNSHNNLCPMNGKECWFHLLYDLGDGGLVTKNVCAYFQNDTMTAHWPPFVEFPQADDSGLAFGGCSGLGTWTYFQLTRTLPFLRLKLSGWVEVNLPTGEETYLTKMSITEMLDCKIITSFIGLELKYELRI